MQCTTAPLQDNMWTDKAKAWKPLTQISSHRVGQPLNIISKYTKGQCQTHIICFFLSYYSITYMKLKQLYSNKGYIKCNANLQLTLTAPFCVVVTTLFPVGLKAQLSTPSPISLSWLPDDDNL